MNHFCQCTLFCLVFHLWHVAGRLSKLSKLVAAFLVIMQKFINTHIILNLIWFIYRSFEKLTSSHRSRNHSVTAKILNRTLMEFCRQENPCYVQWHLILNTFKSVIKWRRGEGVGQILSGRHMKLI